MHRRNYGLRAGRGGSGILIESCKTHGVWFDSAELSGVLNWIRRGGPHDERPAADSPTRVASPRTDDRDFDRALITGEPAGPDPFDLIDSLFGATPSTPRIAGGLINFLFDLD